VFFIKARWASPSCSGGKTKAAVCRRVASWYIIRKRRRAAGYGGLAFFSVTIPGFRGTFHGCSACLTSPTPLTGLRFALAFFFGESPQSNHRRIFPLGPESNREFPQYLETTSYAFPLALSTRIRQSRRFAPVHGCHWKPPVFELNAGHGPRALLPTSQSDSRSGNPAAYPASGRIETSSAQIFKPHASRLGVHRLQPQSLDRFFPPFEY